MALVVASACLVMAVPVSAKNVVITDGAARFQVLTPTLIRLQYAADGHFETRPTMTAVRRSFAPHGIRSSVSHGVRIIRTAKLTLRYRLGSGPFTPQNLSVGLRAGARRVIAHPDWSAGDKPGNLGGWRRSLDLLTGPVPLHDGLLSRAGWYLLDDTRTVLLTPSHAPGFTVRPAHQGAYQDGYLFGYGHDYARGLADLRALTGPTPLLPRKAFGVWFSRYWAYSESEYHTLLGRFRGEKVPLDTLSVDTDFKREANPLTAPLGSTVAGGGPDRAFSWNGWTWNNALFPDPKRFFDWAHGEGLAVTLNVHPSIATGDPHYAETQAASGGLARSPGATCQVFLVDPIQQCGVFDWTKPKQVDAYFKLHTPFENDGVDFWWLDWCCDDSRAQAPGLTGDAWINKLYADRQHARGSRWPAFSRIGGSYQEGFGGDGGGPGAFAEHRSTIQFTGDTCSTWEMLAFDSTVTAAEGSIGLPYVSHDIGSFNGEPVRGVCRSNGNAGHLPDDMYVRWVQFGALQPLDRLHSNHGDRLPWDYPGQAGAIAADFLRLRESLVPVFYDAARESYDNGLPIVRSLYLQWPEQAAAYQHSSEYTVGRDLLVAPVAAPGDPARATVWFPPGTWTDWFTGERHRGPATVQLTVPLDRMPLFVRDGAVVVTQPDVPTSSAGPSPSLILTAWPGPHGTTSVYDDAGAGFGYKGAAFSRTSVAQRRVGRRATVTISSQRGGAYAGRLSRRSWDVRLRGVVNPRAVTLDGHPARGWAYDAASRTLTVRAVRLATNRSHVVVAR